MVILSLCYRMEQNHRTQYEVSTVGEMMRAFREKFGLCVGVGGAFYKSILLVNQ